MWKTLRQNNFFQFDLYIFIFAISFGLQTLTLNLLIQDKICRNVFNQTEYFCQHIEQDFADPDDTATKDQILSQSAMLNNYGNILRSVPNVIWSLFAGSFLDRRPGATRLIFAWICFVDILLVLFYLANAQYFNWSPYYLLLGNLNVFLTGGTTTFLAATNRYIILNTVLKYRPIRFLLFQISMVLASSFGTFMGGHQMALLHHVPQLRSYARNLWITLAIAVASFLLILIIKIDRRKNSINNNNDDNNNNEEENSDDEPIVPPLPSTWFSQDTTVRGTLATLFDLDNVRQTYHSLMIHRPYNGRSQIFFLIAIMVLIFLNYMGLHSVFLQFSEKVYHFDAATYSNVAMFSNIVPTVLAIAGSYVLINLLKLADGILLIITMVSGLASQILIGTIPDVKIFLPAVVIGSLFGLASVIIKTRLSNIVPQHEIGKIFSITSTFESLAPIVGNLLFSLVFSASLSHYPTLIYHLAAFITLITLAIALFQDVYFTIE